MRAILGYVINMLPYMLLAVPVYLIGRIAYVKTKKCRVSGYREAVLFLFVVFAVGLASQTIIPKFEMGVNGFQIMKDGVHTTNLIPFKVFSDTWHEVLVNGYIQYFLINFLGNVILFVPFGLIIPLLWNISGKKTLLIGFGISLFIEICQLFLTRGTDVDDLILNTTGVLLGILIHGFLQKHCGKLTEKFR